MKKLALNFPVSLLLVFTSKQSLNGMVSACQYKQKQKGYRKFSPCYCLWQWSSTFLSLRHTNVESKFCGTPKCKKETKIMKIMLFLHTFFDILRFGGTPRKIPRYTFASRHTGWETLVYGLRNEISSKN